MALSPKMKAFAHAKMQGMSNKDAALSAGYSEKSAGMKGSQLMAEPEVKSYLASLNAEGGGELGHATLPLVQAADAAELKALESIDDPMEGLKLIWKNPKLDIKHRIDALKSALPYVHGKVGEKGVKQGRADAASDVADKDDDFATAQNQRAARGQHRVS